MAASWISSTLRLLWTGGTAGLSGGKHRTFLAAGLCPNPANRSTIVVVHENGDITGIGDSPVRKSAENLAALSALYQLDALGAVCTSCTTFGWVLTSTSIRATAEQVEEGARISGEDVVGWHRHRLRAGVSFYGFLCEAFPLRPTDIVYAQLARPGPGLWQADMVVGDRRIGFGRGSSKQEAMTICYTDVVQYLEKCDPELWEEFMRERR